MEDENVLIVNIGIPAKENESKVLTDHTPQSLNTWLGYCYPAEIDELTRLAQLLPDSPRVLNIGAGGGVSGAVFLAARPDLHLTTVDVQAVSSPFGSLESERTALESCGLWNPARHVQLCADSQSLGLTWIGTFDLIYIDGDHLFEGVVLDIVNWLPHVTPGGLLSVHDYDKGRLTYGVGSGRPHPIVLGGVDQAVQLLLLDYYPIVSQVDSLITFKIGEYERTSVIFDKNELEEVK
jgi:predicted O-methyltransferase YrrM